jgi:hypothetical protein
MFNHFHVFQVSSILSLFYSQWPYSWSKHPLDILLTESASNSVKIPPVLNGVQQNIKIE